MKSTHLKRCQVETPPDVVRLVWSLVSGVRKIGVFDSVLDLGAGDGRFSQISGVYGEYTGIECDRSKVDAAKLPKNAKLVVADALAWKESGYSVCVGNPPYIRHHGLDGGWRDFALRSIADDGGPKLKKTANAFIIFLAQALLRTSEDGLVAQVIPYEWVSRPSASELRDFIRSNGWSVSVYRFESNIFPTVLTTASITVIDKSVKTGEWRYGSITRDGKIRVSGKASGTTSHVIGYRDGDQSCKGIRGLSPGGQDIFVLTEEERLFHSLKKGVDVRPCVTSLRAVREDVQRLDTQTFDDFFVGRGVRCWLIRSDKDRLSPQLQRYLASVPESSWGRYSTCTSRAVWWRYRPHPVPALLLASGFTGKRPKSLINDVGAIAAGSVYGVLVDQSAGPKAVEQVFNGLRAYDFERRLVHHSNGLKKVEVRQLNTVLADLLPD
ncbi:class I SAM-dependent methyltransferase [Xanthomonas massiliensis]|uniref:Eco57I restriction-modification methylase domain-containing protein n=1 Tax=Xanthomonas massiliensis TaxID=1720302 RepID=UPI000A958BE9|nr:class I SAM-dependent methyltransferase [Xanthomonas massiliensis]